MQLSLSLSVSTAVTASPNVLQVAAMFGLGLDDQRQLQLIPPVTLDLQPGRLFFLTGASGSGKSSLLRQIARVGAGRPDLRILRFDALPELPDAPLADCFPDLDLPTVLALLSRAGLADAFVVLRKPSELSDGQRYRLRLAQAMALAQQPDASSLPLLLADEFAATLDRLTAAVIARNLRRWVTPDRPLCAIVATTHDDLLEPLSPDVVIEKHLGSSLEIACKSEPNADG